MRWIYCGVGSWDMSEIMRTGVGCCMSREEAWPSGPGFKSRSDR